MAGSTRTDGDSKVAEYSAILEHGEPRITLHERTGTVWQRRVLATGDTLDVAGVSVPLADLYRNAA